jgi:hypothetical protein
MGGDLVFAASRSRAFVADAGNILDADSGAINLH